MVTFLTGPEEKLTPDAAVNLNVIRNLAHDVRPVSPGDAGGLGEQLAKFDLVVDAVGGTGIRGPLRGTAAEVVRQINAAGRPVVAVDIPTGLDCDTGEAPGNDRDLRRAEERLRRSGRRRAHRAGPRG